MMDQGENSWKLTIMADKTRFLRRLRLKNSQCNSAETSLQVRRYACWCRGVARGGPEPARNLADQLTLFEAGCGQIMPPPPRTKRAIYTSAVYQKH